MKKGLLVVLGLLLFASCQKEIKTGFIDNSKLINEYQKKIDVEATFKTKIASFDKTADSIGKSFQSQAAELQKTDPQLAKKESQQQYQMLGQQYQAFQQNMQRQEQDIQKQSQTEIDTLIKEVKKYVQEYGKKNGYTYILGSNDAGSVMYGEESKDLTKKILEELNKSYKKK
ncbi:MAG: OmpH family outer membrane protein [Aquaticitalea sp.]